MILTCPRCATRYVVREEQVGPQGRKVKCSACGELWRAEAALPEPPALDPYVVVAADLEEAVVQDIEPPEAAVPAFETAPQPQSQAELLARMRTRAKTRRRYGLTMLWGSLAALVTVAAVAVVFRQEIARAWPAAARGYAAVGMPVR